MNKLRQEDNHFYIEYIKKFHSKNTFKRETIAQVFEFAYAMAFGEGEHRNHRSGGVIKRTNGQIFINTFQGKLSELGVYNLFFENNKKAYSKLSLPNFDVYGLGEWDDSDIALNKLKLSIKSTKFYGNLLLLETKDWNEKGEYIPNLMTKKNYIYDYFALVRIKPDGEKIMKKNQWLYSNDINKNELLTFINAECWQYDIPGYITNEDLIHIITNKFILPQNSLLNAKTPMDAENYYVQTGDMRDFAKLIKTF